MNDAFHQTTATMVAAQFLKPQQSIAMFANILCLYKHTETHAEREERQIQMRT